MLAAMSTPALAACGGQVDPPVDPDGGSNDASQPPDSGSQCRTSGLPDGSAPACGWVVDFIGSAASCGFPTDGGPISTELCTKLCGPSSGNQPTTYCTIEDATHLRCGSFCTGRVPEGLRAPSVVHTSAVAEFFARAAYLEAASIDAFYILHDELKAHGAPLALRRASLRAAEDEVRHARMTAGLARRFGGTVEDAVVVRGPVRSLFAIALENAVEGCVRETWGAVLAAWQAEHAEDRLVRAALRTIAEDEARHALLGWKVAAWAEDQLEAVERQRVQSARSRAIDELMLALAVSPEESLVRDAGLPRAAEALALAGSLFGELDGRLASRAA